MLQPPDLGSKPRPQRHQRKNFEINLIIRARSVSIDGISALTS